jgi:hypothetical protein
VVRQCLWLEEEDDDSVLRGQGRGGGVLGAGIEDGKQ